MAVASRISLRPTWHHPPARTLDPAPATEGLLLVAHGSRCAQSQAEMEAFGELVAVGLPGVAVEVGYLEMTDPPATIQADCLVARGCRRIVVLPLMLLGAGHAKSDVPAVIMDARKRHPGVQFVLGSPLGVSRALVGMLGHAVLTSGGGGLPLLVVARGTSDPDANADAYKAARLISEWAKAPFVFVGFSGVTTPSVAEAATVFARLGYRRMAVIWWYLFHGRLIEAGRADLAHFAAVTGVEVVDAGHLGPDPALVPLVVERYREGDAGQPAMNCDTCAYRAPWPGRESRVGQPIGVGHSLLAEGHRHHH
jgi:sirohydrochlorin cobaltochelatase